MQALTRDLLQHNSLYIWIIASIRSRPLDSDFRRRDEISNVLLHAICVYIRCIEYRLRKFLN